MVCNSEVVLLHNMGK